MTATPPATREPDRHPGATGQAALAAGPPAMALDHSRKLAFRRARGHNQGAYRASGPTKLVPSTRVPGLYQPALPLT